MLELIPAGAIDLKLDDYPKVQAWLDSLKRLPKWDEVGGCAFFHD